jgi:hypothetical protein
LANGGELPMTHSDMTSQHPGRKPMKTLKTARAAVCLAASASLLIAAPALAKKPDGVPPGQAKKNGDTVTTAAPSSSACPDRTFTTVFSAYQDNALYTLAPDGDFEAGAAGWTLAGGAAVVDESSSIQLGAALGAKSLELARGASATTPAICVERGFPSFRFVTRGAGVLRVQVLYADGRSKKTGRIKAGNAWKVTRKLSLTQGRFHVKAGESANVQLRFTASRGTVRMDDVYVDPRYRG